MAVLFALLASACGGCADFLGGVASRRLPAVVVVAVSQSAGLAVAVGVVLVTQPGSEHPVDLMWAVGAGVCMVLGLVSFYSALAVGTMGVVAPISALGVLVPVLWGIALLGEAPSRLALGGAALGIAGVVLASGPELSGQVAGRSIVLAVIAGAGFGSATVFIAEAAPGGVAWTVLILKLTVVVLTVPALLHHRHAFAEVPRLWLALVTLAIGAIDVSGILLLAYAMTLGLVSLVGVVASLYPIVTVLLAFWVLRERMQRVQQIGAVVAFAGVALLALG
ncbi:MULTISPECIES: DMT family transporter [unclassified Mycolicibacterium]|uniref:DMT family transporter n=1 Tax=unclassified Mycolicibacterium TaxID=2636767 RepID=UPI0012DF1F89|nr:MULTISPECIES: DMT family transporter [unclassified Mycolicibacterium]MUL81939.1 DMT family transporter [Mycolicibacterium sp. CBMA 329]MUL87705.1 DMT family transporter [Mycolicibacterium sp. CBMA 331]MUL99432.1 DMT family transporter [Mycolicibacterium sp. CBMA 334]MUM29430.1 DMT family transporter [Mycolicibacterium sp. CBMA 295]MUM38002.1 DMT family transporter [Mycolicibacterium sp. CBMA 247]